MSRNTLMIANPIKHLKSLASMILDLRKMIILFWCLDLRVKVCLGQSTDLQIIES